MGQKITQRIIVCNCCGNTPEDGENLWEMGNEHICEECFNNGEYDKYLEEIEEGTCLDNPYVFVYEFERVYK